MASGFFSFVVALAGCLALSCGALLACPATEAVGARDDGFELHMLTDPRAVCLDGSLGGFYVRPGRGDDAKNFLVENEGGGWCISHDDCLARSHTDIGSSKGWPQSGCPGMDGGSNGMLSNDCSVNPFCNYTMVHLNYCDGASFSGDVSAPVRVEGAGQDNAVVYYRGRAILDASIAALLQLGLGKADTVIWKGCSAGGLSVFLHADYVRARLPSSVRFIAMPDGGFFMDSLAWNGQPGYTPSYQWVASAQNVSGSVNADCVRAYAPQGETWKCFMAQYTLPYIRAPLYITQDLNDIWQMQNIARLPSACVGYPPQPACTSQQIDFIHRFRFQMLSALSPLLASVPTSGGFLTTCLNHCHQNRDGQWRKAMVSSQTLVASFVSWLQAGPLQPLVIDDMLGRNPYCVYGY